MDTDLSQRVAAGVAVLDRLWPGWWTQLDCKTLNLGSDCHCVLGQLYGRFWAGVRTTFGVPPMWGTLRSEVRPLLDFARAHGFFLPDGESEETEEEVDARLAELKGLWVAEVEKRRTS